MPANVFLGLANNVKSFITAISSSAGAGDANKIIATDSSGKIDASFMPVGVTADVITAVASGALAAGDYVQIYDNSGTRTCRKADASNGRQANGFVLAAYSNGQTATIYTQGLNTGVTGMTIGATVYLSNTTAGLGTTTAPTLTSGQIYQELGSAESATSVLFEFDAPIAVA